MVVRNLQTPDDIHLALYDDNRHGLPPVPIPRDVPREEARDFSKYVPLPFYEENVVENYRGEPVRHYEIVTAQLEKIANAENLSLTMLQMCIQSYNDRRITFNGLESLFRDLTEDCANLYLRHVIPKIAELALASTSFFKQQIPLLRKGENRSLTMSQQQCASLLANAFLCTFPEHLSPKDSHFSYNEFHFRNIIGHSFPTMVEKLKCILYYFEIVIASMPCGNVTFLRHATDITAPRFASSGHPVGEMNVHHTGTIEDHYGHAHVDFANEFIGGGVLASGCVQEEIRFMICPEMLVSCLVCERMNPNESILIIGAERYSDYTGYGRTFAFKKRIRPPEREIKRDSFGHAYSELIAIDAKCYGYNRADQYRGENINRELIKAYAGFSVRTTGSFIGIATGNWGCGVFNGDKELKSLIQLLAASESSRPLHYFTFGDENFSTQLTGLLRLLYEKNVTIGRLFKIISKYAMSFQSNSRLSLFNFIEREINPAIHSHPQEEVRDEADVQREEIEVELNSNDNDQGRSPSDEPTPKKANKQSTLMNWLTKK